MASRAFNSLYWVHLIVITEKIGKLWTFNSLYWVRGGGAGVTCLGITAFQFPLLGSGTDERLM